VEQRSRIDEVLETIDLVDRADDRTDQLDIVPQLGVLAALAVVILTRRDVAPPRGPDPVGDQPIPVWAICPVGPGVRGPSLATSPQYP
jgi:hypothetical protein